MTRVGALPLGTAVLIATVQGAVTGIAMAQGSLPQRIGWQGEASALAPVAELVREPTPAPQLPLLLTAPAPRAGLFWTLGNPAALPLELNDRYTAFRAEYTDEAGAYRRPLDPASTGTITVSGSGWQPVGARGALSGGVVVRRTSMDQMAAGVSDPYGMSPHLFSDTSGTSLAETAARLDGAGGWRLGGWGLGLALGFDTWTTQTGVSRVPRFDRGVRPAATAGLTRTLGPLVLGAHARWQAEVETPSLVTRGVTDRVYDIAGYTEPVSVDLGPGQGYYRRIERDAAAMGGGAALKTGTIRWIAFGEVTRLNERQSSQQNNNPPTDNWDATGHVLGLSADVTLAGGRGRLVSGLRWTHVSGEATRADLAAEGILYRATDDAVDGGVDLRLRWGSRWETGARLSVTHDYDARDDVLARVGSALRTWSTGLALEAAYDVSGRLTLGLGAGAAWSTPIGSIPDPGSQGAGYQEWLAPALSYYATPALSGTSRVTARWHTGGSDLALSLQYTDVGARSANYQLPFTPAGSRESWDVGVSIAH
jgi:Family of unknown function (DUF6850)